VVITVLILAVAYLLWRGSHVLLLAFGGVLLPLMHRRAIYLPPALTVVVQFLFGELMGVLGMAVAAPLTVSAIVALKKLYVEDALGDEAVSDGRASARE
jgi:predicted PurR-regulated permease PerM